MTPPPPRTSSFSARLSLAERVLRRRYLWRRRKFEGPADQICRQVIEACWNGTFFQTSLGHFSDFWTRDTGICTAGLMTAGYDDRIRRTWEWALQRFAHAGRITTTILRDGSAVELPAQSHDALPWTLRALRNLNDSGLVNQFRPFLETTVKRFAEDVVETATGTVRRALLGIRDAVRYRASAYNITMLAMLSDDCDALGLTNPFRAFRYDRLLIDRYWTGTHFRADLFGDHFSSEANLFPFWCGVNDDRSMWEQTVATIRRLRLTDPLPIRYAPERRMFPVLWHAALFLPNYQGTTVWTWLGAIYLQLCRTFNTVMNDEERRFAAMIERFRTFPELLSPNGSWYRTPFYAADDGMIWAALYLNPQRPGNEPGAVLDRSQKMR